MPVESAASSAPLIFPAEVSLGRGRGSTRSRSGCWTCRGKTAKKRCDEQRPICGRCARLGLSCDYTPRPKKTRQASTSLTSALQNKSISHSIAVSGSSEAACSLAVGAKDHDAIRFFRTAFAELHHTKHPSYGCISIMFDVAREDPMVMHMVLALGFREMDTRRPLPQNTRPSTHHYSASLHLVAKAIGKGDLSLDLDALLATLWLMILYEQQFGDGRGTSNHLKGTASLIQHRLKPLIQSSIQGQVEPSQALYPLASRHGTDKTTTTMTLSLYSVRMLVWIAHIDAAASTSGIGGYVNSSLISILGEALVQLQEQESLYSTLPFEPYASTNPVDIFLGMHRYSNPLYRLAWSDTYPQSELLDDLENRSVFNLFTSCCPLRYMIAQLGLIEKDTSPHEFRNRAASVAQAIRKTSNNFSEILEVARGLSVDTNSTQRLVANIRNIVPVFHAIQLEFLRITEPNTPLGQGKLQRSLVNEIMKLAFQTFRHRGDQGLTRILWPLFVAALETDDSLHRAWILERFGKMSSLGKHIERAERFLRDVLAI